MSKTDGLKGIAIKVEKQTWRYTSGRKETSLELYIANHGAMPVHSKRWKLTPAQYERCKALVERLP